MKNKKMENLSKKMNKKQFLEKYAILIAFFILLITISVMRPNYLSPSNLISVLNQTAINGILAVGITFVLITAGIDISIGSVAALSGVVSAMLAKAGMPVPVAFTAASWPAALSASTSACWSPRASWPPISLPWAF